MTIIQEVASRLGLSSGDLELYGQEIAKVKPQALAARDRPSGRLILVSAITPTPAGEGKTTTSIGLAQGMARMGQSVCLALREPSLGPCMGKKGGGTGGGRCELLPSDRYIYSKPSPLAGIWFHGYAVNGEICNRRDYKPMEK